MKKDAAFNSEISTVISRLRHIDTPMVCDVGLSIPGNITRTDMALIQGVPSFVQILDVATREMQAEAATLASKIKQHNPRFHEILLSHIEQLQQHQGNTIEIYYTTHEQLKKQTIDSQTVIHSGECSPYAGIILCADVAF